jgi:hypothetical protein
MLTWNTPSYTELRMDAEIGSYQDDFDPAREAPAFVRRSSSREDAATADRLLKASQ